MAVLLPPRCCLMPAAPNACVTVGYNSETIELLAVRGIPLYVAPHDWQAHYSFVVTERTTAGNIRDPLIVQIDVLGPGTRHI
jgi:hypothetical protein